MGRQASKPACLPLGAAKEQLNGGACVPRRQEIFLLRQRQAGTPQRRKPAGAARADGRELCVCGQQLRGGIAG
jgi:hypothetical protein